MNSFPMPRKQRPTAQGRDVLSTITPDVLRTRYNVSDSVHIQLIGLYECAY
jgi:hypothetical protein